MTQTHIGLVRQELGKTTGVKYMLSKFDRTIGDTMRIDDISWRVAYIGASRNAVIEFLNGIVRKQNSLLRRETKIANALTDKKINAIFSKIVVDALSH